MYKLVLADDDIEILEYIEHLLDWQSFGFQVMGTAVNGTQAMQLIEAVGPDLLITDITMPGITGLELVRTAKQKNAALKCIILTCHESFQYAKEALSLGVQDYLVKYMLDQDQMEECVIRLKQGLDHERRVRLEVQKDKRLLQINARTQVSQLLKELIEGGNADNYMLKKRLDESVLSGLDAFHVIGFCLDNRLLMQEQIPLADVKLLHFAIINIIDEMFAAEVAGHVVTNAYSCSDDMIVVFWSQPLKSSTDQINLIRKLELISGKLRDIIKLEVSCIISSNYSDLWAFGEIYQWILQMRHCYFYPDSAHIVWNTRQVESSGQHEPMDPGYLLLDTVRTGDFAAIMEQINSVYAKYCQMHAAPEQMIRFYNRFVHVLETELRTQGIEAELAAGRADTYEGYRLLTKCLVVKYLDASASRKKAAQRKEIMEVTGYLRAHLQDAVTCEAMAQMVNMNVSYFSKLFKKETGESFSDYLIRIRIERATLLLIHSDLSMEQITEAIGLANMHYFHRLYKKQTGKTPGMVRRVR